MQSRAIQSPAVARPRISGTGMATRWFSILLTLIGCCISMQAERQVSMAWDASSDTNVTDYIVHYGVRSRTYSREASSSGQTSLSINGLQDGVTYYFAVTAVASSGQESDLSEELRLDSNLARSPSISTPPRQQTFMNVPTAAIPITLLDADSSPQTLRLTATSSNPSLVKDASIVFSGSGTNRTITITPNRAFAGTTIIEVLVNDGISAAATAFELEVLPYTPATFPLTVLQQGPGIIRPNLNGQSLKPGKTYSMSATPSAGYLFAGWLGGVTSTAPSLKFAMQPNLVVEALFVTNLFPVIHGAYHGLFRENDAVRHSNAGAFTTTVNERGKYTGKLVLGGKPHSFSGQLRPDLKATNAILRKAGTTIVVELSFDAETTDVVAGRVFDADWEAPLAGHRSLRHARLNPAPLAGLYTAVLPGQYDPASGPEGHGFATIKVDGNGFASIVGTLGDASKFAQKAALSRHGRWPFYTSLYGGGGSASGWLTITNDSTNQIHGVIDWSKPAGSRTKLHPEGFTNTSSTLGSRYTPPPSATSAILDLPDADVVFSGGNLATTFTNAIQWNGRNAFRNLSDNKLSLSFSASSGRFNGSVENPATGKSAPFSGVVLQDQNFAAGFLSGTNRSARVLISQPSD